MYMYTWRVRSHEDEVIFCFCGRVGVEKHQRIKPQRSQTRLREGWAFWAEGEGSGMAVEVGGGDQ
jgi:hypothetical protein